MSQSGTPPERPGEDNEGGDSKGEDGRGGDGGEDRNGSEATDLDQVAPIPADQPFVHNQIINSRIGTAIQAGTYIHQEAPRPAPPDWPVVIGSIPILASAFQPRTAVSAKIDEARAGHETVVLTQVLAGGGGVGKSQLAASYAHRALHPDSGVDVVVWAPAADPFTVVAAYAEAAVAVQLPGATEAPAEVERNALQFLNWLRSTDRGWLVVLDDVTDFTATGPPWPGSSRRGNGRVLATTRQRGAHASGAGRALVPMDVYSPQEASDYLRDRLTSAGYPYLLDEHAEKLAEALGRLPLALGHAAAYMVNKGCGCAEYLTLFRERSRTLEGMLPPDADTELYGRPVGTALLISLEAAQQTEPKGLALPAVQLAAVLDPAGHPRDLWRTSAAAEYLAERRAAGAAAAPGAPEAHGAHGGPDVPAVDTPTQGSGRRSRRWTTRLLRREPPPDPPPAPATVSEEETRAVLAVLHIYNLIANLPAGVPLPHPGPGPAHRPAHREITIHALTARAARDTNAEPQSAELAAIWALGELWPAQEHADHRLVASLRTNTAVLNELLGDRQHYFPGHLLREKAGISLLHAGLGELAVQHWEEEVRYLTHSLGPVHGRALTARANLAAAHRQAGRPVDAARLLKQVATAQQELRGDEDPTTLAVLAALGAAYSEAGLLGDALALKEQVLASRERVLGPLHPDTVSSRTGLSIAYGALGRTTEALALQERAAAEFRPADDSDKPGFFGRSRSAPAAPADGDHPDAMTVRANLAHVYTETGRAAEAIPVQEEVLAARERVLGPDHPDTLWSRMQLGASYAAVGRAEEALAIEERTVPELERVLGADHPLTLTGRADLAVSYRRTGRNDKAAAVGEEVLTARARVLGRDHPDTLISAANLINAYAEAGRTRQALRLAEIALPQQERVFGPRSEAALVGRHAVATLRIRSGMAALPHDPAAAAEHAAAALEAVGPHIQPRLPSFTTLLRAAHLLNTRAAEAAMDAEEA
ncbi:tetratricopeptide repeat protein [Kitasatospora purpeofusca]|uniref:tetratricopeptide repeat protein n=1 Tax=Kitasatospora purpeofusca TaxID=67352 RepID=UPI0033CDA839